MQTALEKEKIGISVITRPETHFGLSLLNANDKRQDSIGLLLLTLPALPWTVQAADLYCDIAASLQQTGQPIGAMDTMVAATPSPKSSRWSPTTPATLNAYPA